MDKDCECCKHPDWIFVFGSNLAGRHGKGAALHAKQCHGAWPGLNGLMGYKNQCFGIPTKDKRLNTLDLRIIKVYIGRFLGCARDLSGLTFYVTRIGCGLAGYTDKDITPMFKGAPKNCILPIGWRKGAP